MARTRPTPPRGDDDTVTGPLDRQPAEGGRREVDDALRTLNARRAAERSAARPGQGPGGSARPPGRSGGGRRGGGA